jgi:hypothetical protein
MNSSKYFLVSGMVFLIISILHLLRVVFGVGLVIGSWEVPQWVSMAAFVVAGFLAFKGLGFSRKSL